MWQLSILNCQMNINEVITGDRLQASFALNSDITYIKLDTLVHDAPIMWRGQVHQAKPSKVWVSGHSDYPVTKYLFDRYGHNCKYWFATNIEHEDPKLIPIPIGITNYTQESHLHPIYGNLQIMAQAAAEPRPILQKILYVNFAPDTYAVERRPLLERLSRGENSSWVTIGKIENSMEGRMQFLRDIRAHEFVACPRGNGIDTHRTWETLYMGSIPVVQRCTAMNAYADLPICFIDDWSEVTPDFLAAEGSRIGKLNWNMDKTKLSYWVQKVFEALDK